MCRQVTERYDTNLKLGGFNPTFKRPTCLATMKCCDTMKQSVCGWQYAYIYIYILLFKGDYNLTASLKAQDLSCHISWTIFWSIKTNDKVLWSYNENLYTKQ